MEAKSVEALPSGAGWQFEPKWDGFRCLVFKAGPDVDLRAKSGKSLSRYFPEMVAAVRAVKADHFVLDGELTVPAGDTLSFGALAGPHPSRGKPGPDIVGGDAGSADPVRLPGHGGEPAAWWPHP